MARYFPHGIAPPRKPGYRVEIDKGRIPAELIDLAGLESADVLRRLSTSAAGLSDGEAQARLKQHGPNAVAHEAGKSIPMQLLQRLRNPLNLLLLTLASASLVMGDREAALIIFAMVGLSVSLAFLQERRSSKAALELQAMVHTTATVLRRLPAGEAVAPVPGASAVPEGCAIRELPIHELVPGDVIHLCAGDLVPADVRLLSAKDLFVNQASLTGEAMPVEKFAASSSRRDQGSAASAELCFMGTNVVERDGHGRDRAHRTACRTSAVSLKSSPASATQTSFDQGVNRFAWLMIRFILVMAPLVFLINGFTKGDWMEALLFAMAVAVGLTPEMLPMIVTVNLGKGALAMSRRKVIVKRLNSIQNFGAMDVLCADKTGTLTQDRIVLERHVDLHGQREREGSGVRVPQQLLPVRAQEPAGRGRARVRGAARAAAAGAAYRKIDEIPFDFVRRRMSVVVEREGKQLLICKGAVEEVFGVCAKGEDADGLFDLDASHLAQLKQVEQRAQRGRLPGHRDRLQGASRTDHHDVIR